MKTENTKCFALSHTSDCGYHVNPITRYTNNPPIKKIEQRRGAVSMRQARAQSSQQDAAWSGAPFKTRPATANLRQLGSLRVHCKARSLRDPTDPVSPSQQSGIMPN
jgi:hypothetical protein